MDLKKTNHLLGSVEINAVNPSERNNTDKPSVYELTLSAEEDKADSSIDSNYSDFNREERKFSNVSTLDWLQTWRSTKIS
ncbi:hypothetical protein OA009_01400 [Paracoccaceae bacterium]|nr:hypothetical protein [Paracoccaceae bacterium]